MLVELGGVSYTSPSNPSPITLAWDKVHHRPVWSSSGGINVPGATYDSAAVTLLNTQTYGLASLADDVSEAYYTNWYEHKIFYWKDNGNPTPSSTNSKSVMEFTYGYPYRIVQGANGKFYVMLTEEVSHKAGPGQTLGVGANQDNGAVYGGGPHYRIIELTRDVVSEQLTGARVLVDTFTQPNTPSF